jgi:hypothetical protein
VCWLASQGPQACVWSGQPASTFHLNPHAPNPQQTGDNSASITELPVRSWTQPYKEYLEGLLKGAEAKDKGDKDKAGGARKKKAGDDDGESRERRVGCPAPSATPGTHAHTPSLTRARARPRVRCWSLWWRW